MEQVFLLFKSTVFDLKWTVDLGLKSKYRKELCHGGPNQRKIIELNQNLTFLLLDVLYPDTDY